MNKCVERLYNGIIKENPTLVLTLGMCPTLAVTTSAINGIGMGLSSTVVLALSNLMISLLRKAIPDGVRMPSLSLHHLLQWYSSLCRASCQVCTTHLEYIFLL